MDSKMFRLDKYDRQRSEKNNRQHNHSQTFIVEEPLISDNAKNFYTLTVMAEPQNVRAY